jgi:hypothetical protein
LINTQQELKLLQTKIQELKQQHSHANAQFEVKLLDIQRQKESLASSERALEAAQHELRNAHLEIEVWIYDCFSQTCM